VYLTQVTRHLTNSAFDEYDRYGYGETRYTTQSGDRIQVGEEIDDELSGQEWATLDGKKQQWGSVGFKPSSIISSIPLDKWKPTSEEYEGYTGNAGNSLDRWYHRSAIVVWHPENHYKIITRGHAAACIPDFLSKVKKLAKTPKAKLEAARADCLRYAHALIANWPWRWSQTYHGNADSSLHDEFATAIPSLHDRDLVAAFLSALSGRDEVTPINSLVVSACHEFGWDAFERELKLLLNPKLDEYGRQRELALRDLEWLAEVCCDPSKDPERRILTGELCKLAVGRFCNRESRRHWHSDPDKPNKSETMLLPLLRALAASGRDEDFARVIQFVHESPKEFTLDFGQVPALKSLIPWSRKHLGSVYPPLQVWLKAVRAPLEKATAKEPTPPKDWTRPATSDCQCNFCTQLTTFLADPKAETARIPAGEDRRTHLVQQIGRNGFDVKHQLDRTGRPFSLAFTKTTGSYDRAVIRFKKDCRLLSEIQALV
jgi:hypothetical protein